MDSASRGSGMNERHPEHDRIAATVRSWYTTSAPSMGYQVERRPFGCYLRHPAGFGEVTLTDAGPADVPALLADVRAYYGETAASIFVEDRRAEAILGPALVAAGCTRAAAETHLVH